VRDYPSNDSVEGLAKMKSTLIFSTLLSLGAVFAHAGEPAAPPPPKATIEVTIKGPTLASLPVVLELTVKNTGGKPLAFWSTGRLPSASDFEAVIVDDGGVERHLQLSNEYGIAGTGLTSHVDPGQSITFYGAFEPLSAGKYTLKSVACESSGYRRAGEEALVIQWPAMEAKPGAPLVIRDDPAAIAAATQDLLGKVRAEDALAVHMAAAFRIKPLVDAMISDLDSSDGAKVESAARLISMTEPFPTGFGAVIKRSMLRQLHAPGGTAGAMAMLASLAASDGSDDSLDAVIAYVHKLSASGLQSSLHYLRDFQQPRASDVLSEFLKHKDWDVCVTAAKQLAWRRDAAGLPVLLEFSTIRGHTDRASAFGFLAYYPDDPRALAAIEAGFSDSDPEVKAAAQRAMDDVRAERHDRKNRNPGAAAKP
jgi:hypothetical protein